MTRPDMIRIGSALVALFLFLVPVIARAADLPIETLTIVTDKGRKVVFTVELAATDADREIGLMNRQSMPADHGMLFDFGETRPVYMWMKDTLLPLDMLFISADGKVVHIRHDAMPLSRDIIASEEPVRFALEIGGGIAATKGVREGASVSSPTISKVSTNR